MILVDLNQVLISNYMAQTRGQKPPNIDMFRHMVLNSIRGYNLKFKEEYGTQILCADSAEPWRREYFPNYKYQRKQTRVETEESSNKWDDLFDIITVVKHEIAENFPYMVLSIDHAEADDIIAILCREAHNNKEKVMIVSGDKDFIQLHNRNVKQYNPVLSKFVGKGEDPSIYIKEHILKGDRSDGIPNILSDDNVFVENRRQKPLSKKKIKGWIDDIFFYNTFTEEEERNYNRNRKLIDLSSIPQHIEDKINDEFLNVKVATRDKILGYFINKKLKTLIEVIDEF